MNLKIEVSGIASSMKSVEQQLRRFEERVVDMVLQEAPKFTPKRTGRAAAGWEKTGTPLRDLSAVNRVPYVGYLEKPYVKSKQAPQGIIGPTLTSVKGKIK
jgi:hypothetical protein